MRMRVFLAAMLALAELFTAGCRPKGSGAVKVAVIGEAPKIRDPNAGALSAADAVLLSSVAQGLVRFDASGQIEAGLAERWNVSNDGLSYIFRVAPGQWSDGSKLTARQVARLLRAAIASSSRNALKDTLGAIDEIVPMTDRVIEFRLRAPRPNLLQLLAQPEMAILRDRRGTGPFVLKQKRGTDGELRMTREAPDLDGEQEPREEVWLSASSADAGIKTFAAGKIDLLLGGTFADLPIAQRAAPPRGALQFDPAAGLFGLLPLRADGPLGSAEARLLLSEIIDRDAFVAALRVPGLAPRAMILQAGLEGIANPASPAWAATPIADRRAALIAESDRLFGVESKPLVRVALPDGPGADLLLQLLQRDWGLLGLKVERAGRGKPADFRLVDAVAPSSSPAWFLRQFRCEVAIVCAEDPDPLLEAGRSASVPAQRAALLSEAARLMDGQTLFIPIMAPVRWSLVGKRVQGFAGNRFARHTLTALEIPPGND
ncbi:MAG: ABC transporter substrate-binding protein [Sphingomicrobium sp.]